jgi:hypothetical protein
MKCMKKIIGYISQPQVQKTVMLLMLLCIVAIGAFADGLTDPGDDPGNAPVDGGLSLLLAGGIGYGIKQLRKKQKVISSKQKNEPEN